MLAFADGFLTSNPPVLMMIVQRFAHRSDRMMPAPSLRAERSGSHCPTTVELRDSYDNALPRHAGNMTRCSFSSDATKLLPVSDKAIRTVASCKLY